MPRSDSIDDDGYLDDYYDDDDVYEYDDDEPEYLPCPNCGAEIQEDSVRCPICDTYITFSTSMWQGKSLWWIVLGLLGMVAVIYILTLGG